MTSLWPGEKKVALPHCLGQMLQGWPRDLHYVLSPCSEILWSLLAKPPLCLAQSICHLVTLLTLFSRNVILFNLVCISVCMCGCVLSLQLDFEAPITRGHSLSLFFHLAQGWAPGRLQSTWFLLLWLGSCSGSFQKV